MNEDEQEYQEQQEEDEQGQGQQQQIGQVQQQVASLKAERDELVDLAISLRTTFKEQLQPLQNLLGTLKSGAAPSS